MKKSFSRSSVPFVLFACSFAPLASLTAAEVDREASPSVQSIQREILDHRQELKEKRKAKIQAMSAEEKEVFLAKRQASREARRTMRQELRSELKNKSKEERQAAKVAHRKERALKLSETEHFQENEKFRSDMRKKIKELSQEEKKQMSEWKKGLKKERRQKRKEFKQDRRLKLEEVKRLRQK